MNARQKAKRYKKLYENLMYNQTIPFQVNNYKTSTIKACTCVPYEWKDMLHDDEHIKEIKSQIASKIAEDLKETMDIAVDDYPQQRIYRVCGTIRVVTKY